MMNRRFRKPVKRAGAENNQLITLVAFAVTVVGVRIYLEATGYPQIGNGVLHIAHLLWGGLLLFIAMLLPLLIANRWVYKLGALLGGIGVGLFIDEVGKFITRSNDYFFPFAAPIIYGFFMLVLLLYVEVRKPSQHDSRAELYHALDQIMELIENDLDDRERSDLEARLRRVIVDPEYPEHARLAEALLAVIDSDTLPIAADPAPTIIRRFIGLLEALEQRFLTEARYRALLIIGLAVAGVGLMIEFIVYVSALIAPGMLRLSITTLLVSPNIAGPSSLRWFVVLIVLTGIVGLMFLLGDALLFLHRDKIGSEISYLGLLIALTIVNLLLFYFNQFAAVGTTLWEFALIIALLRYRYVYLGVGANINVLTRLAHGSITPEAAFSE